MFENPLVSLFDTARAPLDLPGGAYLFHREDTVRTLYCVAEGAIELIRHQANGQAVTLQRAGPGAILAEASVYAERYHCDAIAATASRVLLLDREALHRALAADPALARDWTAYLAREVQAMRHRAEILALRTVAERLDAWLDWQNGALPAKGAWKGLAGTLGVSPEALYREIARRRAS